MMDSESIVEYDLHDAHGILVGKVEFNTLVGHYIKRLIIFESYQNILQDQEALKFIVKQAYEKCLSVLLQKTKKL